MDKQRLETITVKGGEKMLVREPVNYCGLKDFSMIVGFQKGLIFLLQRFASEQMTEGNIWDEYKVASIVTLFDALEDVTDYKQAYLTRRIEQLEAAVGLCHNGDIDTL